MFILSLYLYACLAAFIILMIWGWVEDRQRGPDPKFGYNIQPRFTFFMGLVVLFTCPGLNLVLFSLYAWSAMKKGKSSHD